MLGRLNFAQIFSFSCFQKQINFRYKSGLSKSIRFEKRDIERQYTVTPNEFVSSSFFVLCYIQPVFMCRFLSLFSVTQTLKKIW